MTQFLLIPRMCHSALAHFLRMATHQATQAVTILHQQTHCKAALYPPFKVLSEEAHVSCFSMGAISLDACNEMLGIEMQLKSMFLVFSPD
jgi:hypothetical protein